MATSNSLQPGFNSYVRLVEIAAVGALRFPKFHVGSAWTHAMMDGQAAQKLRETVPLDVRKKSGAFFSSSTLRAAAVAADHHDVGTASPAIDPAMDAGDLLIEVARQMPVYQSLGATLDLWGSLLHGRDLQPEFVKLAKARLVLLGVSRGAVIGSRCSTGLDETLPCIKVGDGLDVLNGKLSWGHIVMNPPFAYHPAPLEVRWSSGRTNVAATFLPKAVEHAGDGARITAVLPDVIRTVSGYEQLRRLVGSRMHSATIDVFGQFDAWMDVDVFILEGVVGEPDPQRSA